MLPGWSKPHPHMPRMSGRDKEGASCSGVGSQQPDKHGFGAEIETATRLPAMETSKTRLLYN